MQHKKTRANPSADLTPSKMSLQQLAERLNSVQSIRKDEREAAEAWLTENEPNEGYDVFARQERLVSFRAVARNETRLPVGRGCLIWAKASAEVVERRP